MLTYLASRFLHRISSLGDLFSSRSVHLLFLIVTATSTRRLTCYENLMRECGRPPNISAGIHHNVTWLSCNYAAFHLAKVAVFLCCTFGKCRTT